MMEIEDELEALREVRRRAQQFYDAVYLLAEPNTGIAPVHVRCEAMQTLNYALTNFPKDK